MRVGLILALKFLTNQRFLMKLLPIMLGIAAIIAAIILSIGVIHLLDTGSVHVTIGPAAIGKPIVESQQKTENSVNLSKQAEISRQP
jgi:hypothetical protein